MYRSLPFPTVNNKWCKKCGICVEFCKSKVFSIENGKLNVKEQPCVGCSFCEVHCPELAIRVNNLRIV